MERTVHEQLKNSNILQSDEKAHRRLPLAAGGRVRGVVRSSPASAYMSSLRRVRQYLCEQGFLVTGKPPGHGRTSKLNEKGASLREKGRWMRAAEMCTPFPR
jgi:hypothetical protein